MKRSLEGKAKIGGKWAPRDRGGGIAGPPMGPLFRGWRRGYIGSA